MNVRRVNVVTAADGTFSQEVRVPGEILGVFLDIGTLSTPDLTITDKLSAKDILNVDAVAASTQYRPKALAQSVAGVDLAAAAGPPVVANEWEPVVCYGIATVAVAGAGDTKSGTVYIAFRG